MNLSPKNNPNAAASGVGGAGIGTLAVWLLNKYADAGLSPEAAAAIAGAVGAVVLLVGRKGLKGAISAVWKGGG